MFDVGALIISELSLFQKLSIFTSMCAYPFAWWQNHEGQFPNVSFLVKGIFGIFEFKIEIKIFFNLVNVLINLKSFASGKFGSNYHNGKKLM